MKAARMRGLLLLGALLALLVAAEYVTLSAVREGRACRAHLSRVWAALEAYQERWGHFPAAAFFPQDGLARDDLATLLGPYGLAPEYLRCPASGLDKGVASHFIWNSAWNGRRPDPGAPAEWLLIEVEALSDRVPRPHLFFYQALFTDGSVRLLRTPPSELVGRGE